MFIILECFAADMAIRIGHPFSCRRQIQAEQNCHQSLLQSLAELSYHG